MTATTRNGESPDMCARMVADAIVAVDPGGVRTADGRLHDMAEPVLSDFEIA